MSVLVPSFPSSTNSHHHYFSNHRINGNLSQSTKHMSLKNHHLIEDMEKDHVPFGVVNSMKQRLLDKVNESLFLNNNSTLTRYSLSKSSNENLLQIKSNISPLKHTTRLSRSQDNLINNNNIEQFTSYLQPKKDLIIVDTTTTSNDEHISIHRHSYTELHVDEVPKPGTVTTVKNMFERQIRLSRYDCDKLSNTSIPTNSRTNNQHRDIRSPNRSRSISPNDMALRQRRTPALPTQILPSSSSTTLLLPISTSYPDLVISHTPPTSSHIETNEQSIINTHKNINTDETTVVNTNHNRPNLLLSSTSSSDTADYQPLDFKSRLALFKERSNENSYTKKPSNHIHSVVPPSNFLTKPIVHHHHHQSDKKDIPSDQNARSVVNTAKSITFFGGTKLNGNTKSTLPTSISTPSITIDEQPSLSTSTDLLHVPDVIGGNVKLTKSSIFSGMKKDARVKFIDSVNTYEYPSFNIAMAEHGNTDTNDDDDDDDDNKTNMKINSIDENINDVDDDELERLARINAKYNSNNLTEKTLEPKGTLHTFRPTHLNQYELGTQHGFISSDIYSREKYLSLSENFSNHSILKQDKTNNIPWSSMSTTTDLLF